MHTYIGVDLGTSGAKFLLVAADGSILAENTQTYPVRYPQSGWSEQAPEDWFSAAKSGIAALLEGQDRAAVRGISFGGQMHGLVVLDKADKVIRPAILWNDGRTGAQTAYLNEAVGREKLTQWTGNIAFAGFTLPKILWMKENEPENFARIAKIMLPKDYLAYRLSGCFCTDYSDASGTLLLDVRHRRWCMELCRLCGISNLQLPRLFESYKAVGTLKEELAAEFGLSPSVRIVAGAGDNAAAAVGTGVVGEGGCNVSLGTSGTLFVSAKSYREDKVNALHSFCHADGSWHLMGCILSAASCNAWWSDKILQTNDYAAEQAGLEEKLGKNEVFFLPYLMGERSPHNDVNARGAFLGMRPDTTRQEMTLAVLEGVTFALRDCLEAAKVNGVSPARTKLCGGGAKSPLWRKIVANVLGMPVDIPQTEQGPAYGAAMLAMVGCGEYPTVQAASDAVVRVRETILPDAAVAARYSQRYAHFRTLYPALRGVFAGEADRLSAKKFSGAFAPEKIARKPFAFGRFCCFLFLFRGAVRSIRQRVHEITDHEPERRRDAQGHAVIGIFVFVGKRVQDSMRRAAVVSVIGIAEGDFGYIDAYGVLFLSVQGKGKSHLGRILGAGERQLRQQHLAAYHGDAVGRFARIGKSACGEEQLRGVKTAVTLLQILDGQFGLYETGGNFARIVVDGAFLFGKILKIVGIADGRGGAVGVIEDGIAVRQHGNIGTVHAVGRRIGVDLVLAANGFQIVRRRGRTEPNGALDDGRGVAARAAEGEDFRLFGGLRIGIGVRRAQRQGAGKAVYIGIGRIVAGKGADRLGDHGKRTGIIDRNGDAARLRFAGCKGDVVDEFFIEIRGVNVFRIAQPVGGEIGFDLDGTGTQSQQSGDA